MQMCQKVQRAILDHFMTVTLDKWNPAGRVACMAKVESSIYIQGCTGLVKDLSDVWCRNYHAITGPRGTAIYPDIRTTAEFEDPKERFWRGNKEGRVIAIRMLDIQHYIRIVPTLTAPSVMCAETAMKISRCKDDKQDHLQQVVAPYKVSKDQGSHVNKSNP